MARKAKTEIVYRPEADRDLAGIAIHTKSKWGAKQASLYLGDIRRVIERLQDMGQRQPLIEDIYPGLRRIRSGRHFIYFIMNHETIDIIRVLHERRDFGELLG